MSSLFRRTVAGEDPRATGRSVLLAVALLPAVFVAYEYALRWAAVTPAFFPSALSTLVVAAASVTAYRGRGVVAALAFGLFPTLGFAVFANFHLLNRTLVERLTLAATSSTLVVGLVFACFGWAFGATGRHLVGSMSPPRDAV